MRHECEALTYMIPLSYLNKNKKLEKLIVKYSKTCEDSYEGLLEDAREELDIDLDEKLKEFRFNNKKIYQIKKIFFLPYAV